MIARAPLWIWLASWAFFQPPALSWKKTVVDAEFRSEGVAVADVNKDGRLDLLIGDFWYEAPEWKRHGIRPPAAIKNGGLKSYSECMVCWADDLNGDGYSDQIVIGFPGKPAYWYENPKGKPEPWKEHVVWHSACNESPQYVDLFGTGRRVLVMGFQPEGKEKADNQGQMAWFAPGADPTRRWEMHPISEPSAPGQEIPGTRHFSHGLGVGDLSGDGRLDVLCTGGWWEQPAAKDASGPWKFHPAALGEGCADMIVYDLDGTGRPDVLSSSAHSFGIWRHRASAAPGELAFQREDLFKDLVSETHALVAVDMNGDGLKDLVTGKRWWSSTKKVPGADMPARLYWFEARKEQGRTTFVPHEIDGGSGIGTQIWIGDFNGDSSPDVVTANKKGVFLFEQVR